MVEIADTAERIEHFLPELDAMLSEGMITVEKVRIAAYRHAAAPG